MRNRVDRGHRAAARRPEPVVVVAPEIAVAVGRAAVTDAVQVPQRCIVRGVRSVVVQSRRRVILDRDALRAAGGRGAVLDVVYARLTSEVGGLVGLELGGAGDDLHTDA